MLDFKTGEPIGLPSIERFPRFVIQLQSLAKGFVLMNGSQVITQSQKDVLYKIALDSVPRTRRAVLHILASHRAVSTSAAAARLGFTTPVMRGYLAQLSSLTLAQRIPKGGQGQEDAWKLLPVHQKFMERFEKIKRSDEDMFEEDSVELVDTLSTSDEERLQMQYDKQRGAEESEIAKIQTDKGMLWDDAKVYYHEQKAKDPNYIAEDDF
jgi:Mn-dependent DtxR family transcriptional regulator